MLTPYWLHDLIVRPLLSNNSSVDAAKAGEVIAPKLDKARTPKRILFIGFPQIVLFNDSHRRNLAD
ncbi:MAG: hypothetical protein HC932_00995 [Thermales bacterium]|nr:hypothetical protein [Thermales bacterium]